LLSGTVKNDLVMVWRHPPQDISSAITRDGLSSRIRLIQGVSDEDLQLLYCGATAMVFPSDYEGFGLPVLEAMACGTPVVTTRSSSLPEISGDAAIYVDTRVPTAVRDALAGFEDGAHDVAGLRSAGLQRAGAFTWDTHVRQMLSLYEKCLDS
jgi:glycosyltransferase involved in cell wall biosynthesis